MILEAAGGYFTGSLAIFTDAAHLLSDLIGFSISIFSVWISSRTPTGNHSFGYHRAEIVGALIWVLLIWTVTLILVWESIQRILHPPEINGKLMFIISTIGFFVNGTIACVLGSSHNHSHGDLSGHSHHGSSLTINTQEHYSMHDDSDSDHHSSDGEEHDHKHDFNVPLLSAPHANENLNVKAALLHALGDLALSFGVIIASIVVWVHPSYAIVDPLCTILFALIILATTLGLVKDTIHILMEGTPKHINHKDVLNAIKSIENVAEVHDLHIWSLSSDKTSLSVHIKVKAGEDHKVDLTKIRELLKQKFALDHTTIQIEN